MAAGAPITPASPTGTVRPLSNGVSSRKSSSPSALWSETGEGGEGGGA